MVSVASSVPLLHEMPARLQLDSLVRSRPLRDGRTYFKILDRTVHTVTRPSRTGRTVLEVSVS